MDNGFIFYEGESLLNGKPIVGIATGITHMSVNPKTGPMVQTWVLLQDEKPTDAIKSGTDEAVCGNCPLRGGICYVNQAPVVGIWQKYKDGRYPYVNSHLLKHITHYHLPLRITAYGDAAAIPLADWLPLINASPHHTGYTHQWRTCDQRWRNYLMASIETEADTDLAKLMEWRYFRILQQGQPLLYNEKVCPNTLDDRIKCATCKLCDGNNASPHKTKPNIANFVHGSISKQTNFADLQSLLGCRAT